MQAVHEIEQSTAEWTANRLHQHLGTSDGKIAYRLYTAGLIEQRPGRMYRSVPGAKTRTQKKTAVLELLKTGRAVTALDASNAVGITFDDALLILRALVRERQAHRAMRKYVFGPGTPQNPGVKKTARA
jgi:hypothetical protein